MQKVRLTIKGLSYSERQTGAYALLLAEENGNRKLPIVIGSNEAQSIALAMEKTVNPPRPLTHDLFKNVLDTFSITVTEVVIHKIHDGVFYASLITKNNGKTEMIDARPSDAVALAVRFKCAIFTTEEVLQKAGMILDEEREESRDISVSDSSTSAQKGSIEAQNPIETASTEDLNDMMAKAILSEDYELAARLRDEIEKRKNN